MNEYQEVISILSLTMGVAWASGINLYAALLMLGISGATGNMTLPPELEVLQNPMVIGAAGFMYLAEFFADKTPGVDTAWDSLHTFIRIPAGAMLAASAVGEVTPAWEVAAGILGGGMAASSHAVKAGSRILINASPEPVSNWAASLLEDIAVIGGLWAAVNYPLVFLGMLLVFIILVIWLLPKLWRGIKALFCRIGKLLGMETEPAGKTDNLDEIGRLKELLDQGDSKKQELL
jgi:hypothetical protein